MSLFYESAASSGFRSTSILFTVALAVLLCHATSTATETQATTTSSTLLTALDLGKESFLRLLLDTENSPPDSRIEAITALLTLFDLQDQLSNRLSSASEGETTILANEHTLMREVIQDSCNYINFTLYNDITSDGDECRNFTRQTFNCTREEAQKLKTKLELLMVIKTAEDRVGKLAKEAKINFIQWIDENFNNTTFLKCVEDNI